MMEQKKLSVLSEVIKPYLSMRDLYLSNAKETIKKGEPTKASELLWGAATQGINALAAASGIKITKHKEYDSFVKELTRESKDLDLLELFRQINSLHGNFYHEFISKDDLPYYYEKTVKFLGKLEWIMKHGRNSKEPTAQQK